MSDLDPTRSFYATISAEIWDMKYRFKDPFEGVVHDQTVEDTWHRVAKALAGPEKETDASRAAEVNPREYWAQEFYEAMADFKFLPAGRIIAGAGTDRGKVTLFNCYVMGTIPDAMGGIFDMLKEAALTMQSGGGIGYDFSTLRPAGAPVKGVGADASGPLTFMDVWDAMCRTVMSAGSRRGAMMATMRCDHPDIIEFAKVKADPNRLRMFNMSVLITDAFMAAVKKGELWDLTFNGHVFETISARTLWDEIIHSTYVHAEPGVIFIDKINRDNNLSYMESISATNPCGEQPLPPYGACLLGSINLARLVENAYATNAGLDKDELKRLVVTAVRMMDNVNDISNFPLVQQRDQAQAKRRIGLGITGLADALLMCGLRYGSDEAAARAQEWVRLIALNAYQAGIDLAIEKGPFPALKAADYAIGENFAARVLTGEMKAQIMQTGIRNSHYLSIAPTGTISLYAGNVSSGVEPIFAPSYMRKVLQPDGSRTEQCVMDYAIAKWEALWYSGVNQDGIPNGDIEGDEPGLPPNYVDAQTLDPADHVKMQAAIQPYIDTSISKTVNVPVDIPFDDFKAVYQLAYDSDCKGCTTYRPNEITGSVISVEEKSEDPRREIGPGELKDAAERWLKGPNPEARKESLRYGLKQMGIGKVVEAVTIDQRYALMDMFDPDLDRRIPDDEVVNVFAESVPIHADPDPQPPRPDNIAVEITDDENPLERPFDTSGHTYKVKLGSEPAFYVTVNDIEEDGKRRPFEVFITAKNPEHMQWTNALALMVSAVFRRPHDSTFIVEELKSVFDPKGGGFWEGKFWNSTVAAIGRVIEVHMIRIGYINDPNVPVELQKVAAGPVKGGRFVHKHDNDQVIQRDSVAVGPPVGPSCPSCHGRNLRHVEGCETCGDCGYSRC